MRDRSSEPHAANPFRTVRATHRPQKTNSVLPPPPRRAERACAKLEELLRQVPRDPDEEPPLDAA